MKTSDQWPVRWDALLRYRLIESVAQWERRLTTNHLMGAFGIGRQQASRDINAYLKVLAPGNLEYDAGLKGYKPSAGFTPVFTEGTADEYLALVKQRQEISHLSDVGAVPQIVETLTPPHRDLRPEVLAPLMQAAKEGRRIEIEYCSLTQLTPEARVIQPHSVVFNGHRWHTRAWCEKRSRYSDFVLSRIADAPDISLPGEHGIDGDEAWNTLIELHIGPDPRLKPLQRDMIERDYAMRCSCFTIKTRAALANYTLQNLRIESESGDTPPEVSQIVLLNRQEISRWLFQPASQKGVPQ